MRLGDVGLGNAVHEQPLLPRFAVGSFCYTDEGQVTEAECLQFLVDLAPHGMEVSKDPRRCPSPPSFNRRSGGGISPSLIRM